VHPLQFREQISRALAEDLAYGDKTTDSIFIDEVGMAELLAKEAGIVAGLSVAAEVFAQLDPAVVFTPWVADGERISPGDVMVTVHGRIASILKGERTALNFLQRLSGIATLTGEAVHAVAGTNARIVDTRKTTPGLRLLEKHAVRMGGGENHRLNLADMVMIKDNHIQGAGSITDAVNRVRKQVGFPVKIEVEAASLDDVDEALSCQVDVIMLDNMTSPQMEEAVKRVSGRALVEASGGITAQRLREVAETGVDLISLGYLTHGYHALDLSLKLK
jgi:nicotinate-nucleotide pyrophosphorylase (carboxylating)